jgi:hypothetical protein
MGNLSAASDTTSLAGAMQRPVLCSGSANSPNLCVKKSNTNRAREMLGNPLESRRMFAYPQAIQDRPESTNFTHPRPFHRKPVYLFDLLRFSPDGTQLAFQTQDSRR